MGKKLLLLFFLLLFSSKNIFAEVPIEIDLKQGGAITYVGLDGENVVDTNDCGRLIQLALYDYDLPRVVAGSTCVPGNPNYSFVWDPVQACDGCRNPQGGQILAGSDKTFIRVRPRLWLGNGAFGDFVIEQRITPTAFNNAIKVSYKIIHEGTDHHNLAVEFPATWVKGKYSKWVYYNGSYPWTNDTVTESRELVPGYIERVFRGTESWGAMVDPATNRGIAVYDPQSLFGISFSPNPDNTGSNHAATMIVIDTPANSEFNLEVYLLTGSWQDMRNTIYQLPRNSNYLMEPKVIIPAKAVRGQVLRIPLQVTNKTLMDFHKSDGNGYSATVLLAKRKKVDGEYIGDSDWTVLTSDIPVGQSADFILPVRMPDNEGRYQFEIDVLNRYWLIMAGFPRYKFIIDVVSSLPEPTNTQALSSSEVKFLTVPLRVNAGETFAVSVEAKNTGTTSWSKKDGYALGTQDPFDNLIWVTGRIFLADDEVVPPNSSKVFTFNLKAPDTAGVQKLSLKMVQDGVEWFGEKATTDINVEVAVLKHLGKGWNWPASAGSFGEGCVSSVRSFSRWLISGENFLPRTMVKCFSEKSF